MLILRFQHRKPVFYTICTTLLLCSFGCSDGSDPIPELAEVTGTVTLDGAPLPGASIMFIPKMVNEKNKARSSSGTTDAQGHYELMYNANATGTIFGEHTVRISKTAGNPEDAGPETLPSKFNSKSTLSANVTPDGEKEINFDLKSK